MSLAENGWVTMIGHEWAVDLLSGELARGRLAHAYLLTGPAQIGKTTLARSLAQAINCEGPERSGVAPCLACRPCQLIGRDGHPDVRLIEPALSSSGRTETLRIDQVRALQKELALTPYEARYRVAILTRFEEASAGAANALLKTLEEPPGRVVLILTAESADALLPTIVSRCQQLHLRPLPLEKVEAALLARWGADEDQARRLAHLSDGRLGLAVHLLTQPQALAQRNERLEALERLLVSDRTARFEYADKLTGPGKGPLVKETLVLWLGWWRDVMLLAGGEPGRTVVTNVDRRAQLEAAADRYGVERASAAVRAIQATLGQVERNANLRLALEVLLLNLPLD